MSTTTHIEEKITINLEGYIRVMNFSIETTISLSEIGYFKRRNFRGRNLRVFVKFQKQSFAKVCSRK